MIGVSDAAPPRAVNQPELAVDELSQICEGLARQRPENMPALLNALALIAPLLNAIPNVVFFIKDRQARYLLANLTLARRRSRPAAVVSKASPRCWAKPPPMSFLPRWVRVIPNRICGCCAKV